MFCVMVFWCIFPYTFLSWVLLYLDLLLFYDITNVEISHFHTSGSLSFHSSVCNSCWCGVVAIYKSEWFRVFSSYSMNLMIWVILGSVIVPWVLFLLLMLQQIWLYGIVWILLHWYVQGVYPVVFILGINSCWSASFVYIW